MGTADSVKSQPAAGDTSDRILVYDGQCRLCVTAKEGFTRVEQRDTDVRWVPYQSEEAASRLGSLYHPGRPDVAFLIESDGTIKQGLEAFLALLPGVRGGRLLASILRLPVLRPLAHLAYRMIARYRYRWFGSVSPS